MQRNLFVKMEITNGRNNSIVNVCWHRTKTYRNDLYAFGKNLPREAQDFYEEQQRYIYVFQSKSRIKRRQQNFKNRETKMIDEKLKELHGVLANELLKRVKDPEAKASDLNVARQFLKDNGIEGLPADNTALKELVDELPFEEAQGLS